MRSRSQMANKLEKCLTLGVDIGGTKVVTALIDSSGNIAASDYRLIGPVKNPENILESVVTSVKTCYRQNKQRASAMGIGVAGQIDKNNGIVRHSPNLPGWQNVPLRDQLQNALGIPVIINNDVRAITFGEWQYGAGKGIDDLICLFVGTGIGGGIISGGSLIEGCQNSAGELGHTTIVVNARIRVVWKLMPEAGQLLNGHRKLCVELRKRAAICWLWRVAFRVYLQSQLRRVIEMVIRWRINWWKKPHNIWQPEW
jgi:predicted NBD/HSP70 family sugar kinase